MIIGNDKKVFVNELFSYQTVLNYIIEGNDICFYVEKFLSLISNYSLNQPKCNDYVELSDTDKTSSSVLSACHWKIRNDSWEFESIRSNYGIKSHKGKYIYEIVLDTDGIIQIGWATKKAVFYPKVGDGIGGK